MSTQIQLHERTEEMTDEMLRAEGFMGGPLAQLTSTKDYMDEMMECISDADSHIVGDSYDVDGARDIADLFDGPTEVTETKIKQASATIANTEDLSLSILEFLEAHEGDEVFAVHW